MREAPAARLLTGRRGSSPPRAARRPQPRPGHVNPPPPAACGLAAIRELRGSASGALGLGPGRGCRGLGRSPSAPISGAGKPARRPPPPKIPDRGSGLGTKPGRGPESPPPGDPCRKGQKGERPRAPWRLRGAPACSRFSGAFPGLGERRLPASHAVTAGEVLASPRAKGLVSGRTESFAH